MDYDDGCVSWDHVALESGREGRLLFKTSSSLQVSATWDDLIGSSLDECGKVWREEGTWSEKETW